MDKHRRQRQPAREVLRVSKMAILRKRPKLPPSTLRRKKTKMMLMKKTLMRTKRHQARSARLRKKTELRNGSLSSGVMAILSRLRTMKRLEMVLLLPVRLKETWMER